jgi:hypothetical protein
VTPFGRDDIASDGVSVPLRHVDLQLVLTIIGGHDDANRYNRLIDRGRQHYNHTNSQRHIGAVEAAQMRISSARDLWCTSSRPVTSVHCHGKAHNVLCTLLPKPTSVDRYYGMTASKLGDLRKCKAVGRGHLNNAEEVKFDRGERSCGCARGEAVIGWTLLASQGRKEMAVDWQQFQSASHNTI